MAGPEKKKILNPTTPKTIKAFSNKNVNKSQLQQDNIHLESDSNNNDYKPT